MAIPVETVIEDLERSRMQAEDLRGRMFSPYSRTTATDRLGPDLMTWEEGYWDRQSVIRDLSEGMWDIASHVDDWYHSRISLGQTVARVQGELVEHGFALESDDDSDGDAMEEERPDTRPLITPAMRRENRALWDELWNRNQGETCSICNEPRARLVMDGPMNSDLPTRCTHWACTGCWATIAARGGTTCPFCRENIRE